jgi:signal peptidase I
LEKVMFLVKKTVPAAIILFIMMIILSIFASISSNKPLTVFGFKPLTVLSNSMVPVFEAGDVIITREIDAEDLKEGDIISFYNEEKNLITHRITSIVEKNGERLFFTKGDNNNTADEEAITAGDIAGKELFHIPKLGFLSNYTKGPMGFLLFIVLPLTGYICLTVYEKLKQAKKQEKKQEEFTKS